MTINYDSARQLLNATFQQVEKDVLNGNILTEDPEIQFACNRIFESSTQAYREVVLGSLVAKIQDKDINIRQPYIDQDLTLTAGGLWTRELLTRFCMIIEYQPHESPYLSVFRRSVHFDDSTRAGLRDKDGYDAFLKVLSYVEDANENPKLVDLLTYLLYRFIQLREAAEIPLSRVQRISLEQYDTLITGLLNTPSGGRFPVLLIVATFKAIKSFFNLDWEISWQGINVADAASGAGGDITINSNRQVVMAAEVTERPIDKTRVVTTFNTKIAPSGITDYLFFVRLNGVASDAKQQANLYFAQGHEVNFLEIKDWILSCLATIGSKGRAIFNREFLSLLDTPDTPRGLKVAWNNQIINITKS